MTDKRKSDENVRKTERSKANLGQKDAELEKASETQLRHLEGGEKAKAARQRKKKYSSS